jgi:16S rRNA processing protein RimM
VVLGRITAPYGVKGWVRVHPVTAVTENLLRCRPWWLGHDALWEERHVLQARVHGAGIVAQLAGCEDRDAASALRGREVAVARDDLPATRENEYYWADLIGLRAVTVEGAELGVVVRILETGANDVLVVRNGRERLIPFIATVVREIDLTSGVIRLEWGVDY